MKEHLISFAEAETNLASAAAYLAENIGSSDGHAEAVQEIVGYYISKNEVDLAAAFADTVRDNFVRDNLLVRVAEKCAAAGDYEYAEQLAEAVEDYGLQSAARERIAVQRALRGEIGEALKITAKLPHPSGALAEIAVRQAVDGDAGGFRQTLSRVEFPAAKVHALQSAAAHFQESGERQKVSELLDEAAAEAQAIEFPEEKIRALLSVAAFYIEIEQFDKAIETLARTRTSVEVLDSVHRENFLSFISLDFLRAGSIDLADRTLDLIADKTMIASTLTGFSAEFDAKGERGDALDTLEEAYAILKSQRDREVRDSRARFNLLGIIAVRFAALGKIERAIGVALENPVEREREDALAEISEAALKLGSEESARQAIGAIESEAGRISALITASDTEIKLGEKEKGERFLDEAAALAACALQVTMRLPALNRIAQRYFDFGDETKARETALESLQAAKRILDETHRATALLRLAEVYEKCGFKPDAAEKEIVSAMLYQAER